MGCKDGACSASSNWVFLMEKSLFAGSCWRFGTCEAHTQSFFQCVEKVWVHSWRFQFGNVKCTGNLLGFIFISDVNVKMCLCTYWRYHVSATWCLKFYFCALFLAVCLCTAKCLVQMQPGQRSYPLRPELIESTYWLYKATRDSMCMIHIFYISVKRRSIFKFAHFGDINVFFLADCFGFLLQVPRCRSGYGDQYTVWGSLPLWILPYCWCWVTCTGGSHGELFSRRDCMVLD